MIQVLLKKDHYPFTKMALSWICIHRLGINFPLDDAYISVCVCVCWGNLRKVYIIKQETMLLIHGFLKIVYRLCRNVFFCFK